MKPQANHSRSYTSVGSAILSMWIAALCSAAPAPDAIADATPHVIRTMTHHQVTTLDKGIAGFHPVLSGSGNRIVFGAAPHADGQPARLAIVDFDAANLHELDDLTGINQADVSADGSLVAYAVGTEVRVVAADGSNRRTVLKFDPDGNILCVRISGDGRMIFFLNARGMNLTVNGKTQTFIRGIYAVDADGGNFRRVAGPDEIARLRGINPDDVGNPNFGLDYNQGTIGVSFDGRRIAFGCWAKSVGAMLGCDGDGRNLHTIMERQLVQGGSTQHFCTLDLSGDGTTVGYHAVYPDELGVVRFDGTSQRTLLQAGPGDQRFGWASSLPLYISADGSHLTYSGRYFNTDGSGYVHLLHASEQEGVLRYWEYEHPAMDANGRRFAYWAYGPRPMQLATLELNVPWDQLRGAPRISDIALEPASIPRRKDGVKPSQVSARADSNPMCARLTGAAYRDGQPDPTFLQWGSYKMTDMLDDGKTDADGDAKAGDGVYTGRWLQAYPDAPDGPRSLRLEAQITGADHLFHASVVEIGPFPVVDGSAPPPPPVTIAGTPPLQPAASTGTTGTTAPVVIPPGPTGPAAGAIDLTGYWKTDLGEPYFIRQMGTKVYWSLEGLPRVRNIFMGTIDGATLGGTWVDLPGGAIETDIGTLTLNIDSNDKLTKVSSTIPYGGSVWTRTTKPGGTGGATTAGGTGTGGTAGPAPKPWETPAGQACFEKWIALATARLNAYDGSAEYNSRKPYSINKYGLIEGKGLHSAFAPDGFKDHGNNRYWFMWDNWVMGAAGWSWAPMNAADVPDLHDYVARCQADMAAGKP